ncbi:MAG TPA: transcription elongation factor Spt5 [Thermoplasmata archaeon]|nr:transcription elongation factor Spt5 [Thermoplasmata archaeon]HUJ78259.1 transcription elongation factor Spt5 [Thermoplasmata archaeon]
MRGNSEEEGIGLITGEEAHAPAPPKGPAAPAAAPAAPVAAPAPPAPKVEPPGLLDIKPADDLERAVTAGNVTTLSAVLTSRHPAPGAAVVSVEIAYTSTYPGEGAEWPVSWLLPGKKNFKELVARKERAAINLTPGQPVPIAFEITAPVGVRYGDRVEIRLTAEWEDHSRPSRLVLACIARQAVLAIKTSRGYEREVADTLHARAEEKRDVVFAILVPAALRGYVFAEGMSFEGVHEMLKGIRKARGLVAGETTLKEVEPLLVPKITVEGFVEGAIVELIAGPFKGEKARVKKIDQAKEEITVELIEAVVPIPVTVRGDHVRMLEKGSGKAGG